MRFEYIMSKVGQCGRWQLTIFGLICLVNLIINLHNASSVFLALTPEHRCSIPGFDLGNVSAIVSLNWTTDRVMAYAVPRLPDGRHDKCSIRNRNYEKAFSQPWTESVADDPGRGEYLLCDSWMFQESSQFGPTIVSQWRLVCNSGVYKEYAKQSFVIGILLGSLFWGFISDRCGRRNTALAGMIVVLIAGIMTPFSFHYVNFILLRVLVGLGCSAVTSSYYLLLSETVTYRCRCVFQVIFLSMMTFALMVMPTVAQLAHSWSILSLSLALSTFVLLVSYWIIPESPRWLLVKGRLRESCKVLQRIARINGETVDEDELLNMISDCHRTKMTSYDISENRTVWWLFVNLFQQEMVKTTIICAILWMAACSSMCILMSASISSFAWTKSLSQSMFYSGLMDLPNYVAAVIIARHIGRKAGIIAMLACQGIFCFFLALATKDSPFHLGKILSVICQGLVNTVMCTIFVYTVELFPTRHRHLGLGFCSFCGKIGHVFTSYILPLLMSYGRAMTLTLCGIQSILVAILCILLQDTKNKFLPDTLEDVKILNVLDENHINTLSDRSISSSTKFTFVQPPSYTNPS